MKSMTLEAFKEASDRVREVTEEIKLVYSSLFSKQSGSKAYLKPENLQQTSTHKMRGAYYKISTTDKSAWEKGLIIASTRNHMRGAVFAAKLTGVKMTVYMPTVTPLMKINRTKALGAEVVLSDDVFDDVLKRACEITVKIGTTFVHPFDNLTVATGQDSIAMEIVRELPTVGYTLVSVSGGGLASGVSTLTKLLNPNIHMTGAEPENTVCIKASFMTGEIVTLLSVSTIADGAAVKRPGEKTFLYIQKNLDDIITTQDNEPIVSFLDIVEDHKMIVENPGLLTVAALKHLDVENKKIVSILSGGNTDATTITSLIQHGLIQRDHIFTVSVLLPDKPGQLARVAEAIAEESGNVIKLEHNQFMGIDRNAVVELRVTMETFDTEHKEKTRECLKKEGYCPKLARSKGTRGE